MSRLPADAWSDRQDRESSAVSTLAEFIYECGFSPERAEAIARSISELPDQGGVDW